MEYLTTDTELASVADAIRQRGGTSAPLTYPAGFISAIQAIPAGGTADWSAMAVPLYSGKHIHESIPINTQEAFQKALNLADLMPVPYAEMSSFTSSVWYRFSTASSGTAGLTLNTRSRFSGIVFGTIPSSLSGRIGPAYLNTTLANNVWLTVGITSSGSRSGNIVNLSTGSCTITSAARYQSRYLSFRYYSAVSKLFEPFAPLPGLYWTRDLDGRSVWISGSYSDAALAPMVNSQISGPWNSVSYQDVYLSGLTVVGSCFFRSKSGSMNLYGTASIQNIGQSAFAGCDGLTAVSLPACGQIASYAFYSCRNLLSVYLMGSSLCGIGSYAFGGTPIGGTTASTGGVYGSIYVPMSLLSEYRATIWSAYSARLAGVE